MTTTINFNGSIPHLYEGYLTKFLFEGFAEDIVTRVRISPGSNVLELAAGTGCVTRKMLDYLPVTGSLTATDLQEGMLNIAKSSINALNVDWAVVDMTDIPYNENFFDVVVCQFGIMLVPDKLKALQEIYRVLKPGGQLVFNVWGNIENNPVWNIGGTVVASFIGDNPILQDPGPFSMNENTTLTLLEQAGFISIKSSVVELTGNIESAALGAKGFIGGLPVVLSISKSNPDLIPDIEQALREQLSSQLGDHPLQSKLQALVFESCKQTI